MLSLPRHRRLPRHELRLLGSSGLGVGVYSRLGRLMRCLGACGCLFFAVFIVLVVVIASLPGRP